MASVELTIDQILDAVRQLPDRQRQKLLRELAKSSPAERARAAARRLRNSYRMEGHRSKRMSQLLVKADAGVLTSAEGDELDRLVTEFEKKTLAMAQAVVASFESPEQLDPANRQSSR